MSNEITVSEKHEISSIQGNMSVSDIKEQVNYIQEIMASVMKDGEHYGAIKGCGDKKVLLKPGAEKLMMTFRFCPEITGMDDPYCSGDHREYRIKVKIYSRAGEFLGDGVGSCSTKESKYRYRTGEVQLTDKPVPQKYWTLKKENFSKSLQLIGGPGHTTKKDASGQWVIAIQGEKAEHDNPADYYNTVLKMAKKRAMVDAILTVTAASDIFSQDIDDPEDNYIKKTDIIKPETGGKPETSPPEKKPSVQGACTAKQAGMIQARLKEKDKDLFHETYRIEHIPELPFNLVQDALDKIEKGVFDK